MKLTWLTDIHLCFLEKADRLNFYHAVAATHSDAVLISGDIAEAPSVVDLLQEMVEQIQKPIYFVLGNHDYYKGTIKDVKDTMRILSQSQELLHWLPAVGAMTLIPGVLLVGVDGWADGRLGDYYNSRVSLNDNRYIVDLVQAQALSKQHLLEKMQQLADSDANLLTEILSAELQNQQPQKIIILTHIPPFKEACCHKNKMSDNDWLPYFTCKAIGDVLLKFAKEYPDREFLVLAGHTHTKASYQPLENLMVKVGVAENFHPEIQEVFRIAALRLNSLAPTGEG